MLASTAIWNALSAVALLALLAGCGDQATSAASKPDRPVLVSKVEFQSENGRREFVGVVRARHETDLGFRVAGKIVARTSTPETASVPAMWWRNSIRRI